MDPIKIIEKYYDENSELYRILIIHSKLVTDKAVEIAENVKELNPDIEFIKEASMLHDIGIYLTNAPGIYCFGKYPYVCHGYLGRELLEKEGFLKHALVCERHVGMGITIEKIVQENLPMPKRDMTPQTLEEEIISFADKFFSKGLDVLEKEKTIEEIIKEQEKYNKDAREKIDNLVIKFKINKK